MLADQEETSAMLQNNNAPMNFIPLHFGDKLRTVNPNGRIGIITLWSKIDFIEEKLIKAGVDLGENTSNIAVIGNLYGNGIPHLIRNLLYNPQIRSIIICGADRSGSKGEFINFFELGVEETEILCEPVIIIRDTKRVVDHLIKPELFKTKPIIKTLNDIDNNNLSNLKEAIDSIVIPDLITDERIEIPLPEIKVTHYPSQPQSHTITAESPLTAWRELIFRLVRFGHLIHLRKGDRQELQNVKVVIDNPSFDDKAELEKFGFDIESLKAYQKDMLLAALPEDHSYTYGNRIREYYGFDSLEKFAARLINNPQDRDCYLALWDSYKDIDSEDSPCLVSLFFRVYDNKLTLTASYRTHNAVDAWLKNIYGLIAAQKFVAEKINIEPGPVTVISHSISIDPSRYDTAQRVCSAKEFSISFDPNGQFTIDVDNGEIVVRHFNNAGIELKEYRSKKAERLQHELYRDCTISDINHALYIGRQLAKAEYCIKSGEVYIEE